MPNLRDNLAALVALQQLMSEPEAAPNDVYQFRRSAAAFPLAALLARMDALEAIEKAARVCVDAANERTRTQRIYEKMRHTFANTGQYENNDRARVAAGDAHRKAVDDLAAALARSDAPEAEKEGG